MADLLSKATPYYPVIFSEVLLWKKKTFIALQ
jgi:hypothetical protein